MRRSLVCGVWLMLSVTGCASVGAKHTIGYPPHTPAWSVGKPARVYVEFPNDLRDDAQRRGALEGFMTFSARDEDYALLPPAAIRQLLARECALAEFTVVEDPSQADYLLLTELLAFRVSLTRPPLVTDAREEAVHPQLHEVRNKLYDVAVTVHASLLSRENGAILFDRSFTSQAHLTEEGRLIALHPKVLSDQARELRSRMSEAWDAEYRLLDEHLQIVLTKIRDAIGTSLGIASPADVQAAL